MPRLASDYTPRQVEAAHRVLVDLGQVLASFHDAFVLIGGWVPDILLPDADPAHTGSIDIDLALDAGRLDDGRYAEILKLLLATGRYRPGAKPFQFTIPIDLQDGEAPIDVDVDFLAASDVRLQKHRPKLIDDFRVLQFPACAAAFHAPVDREIDGNMAAGALNRVHLRIASLADFLILKAHAIEGRDKPKDVYDLCFVLDAYPGGIGSLAADWRRRRADPLIAQATQILTTKFASVNHYGPQQLVIFHDSPDPLEQAQSARRAYELVQALLAALDA